MKFLQYFSVVNLSLLRTGPITSLGNLFSSDNVVCLFVFFVFSFVFRRLILQNGCSSHFEFSCLFQFSAFSSFIIQ